MMTSRRSLGLAVLLAITSMPAVAAAQTMGTFRWQLQPFCNVLSLTVTQLGALMRVEGVDNQCGAATAASAVGTAFVNPNGTVGLGLTLVTSAGALPVHVDAIVDLASLNGTWRDSIGHAGTLAFGAASGGAPRPAPTALSAATLAVTGNTIVGGAFTAGSVSSSGPAAFGTVATTGNTLVGNRLGIGTTAPTAKLHVAGGDIHLDNGELTRASTGVGNNLLPMGMAHVQGSGSKSGGSSNITTSWDPVDQHYVINLNTFSGDLIPVIGVLAGQNSLGRSATWLAGTSSALWVYVWDAAGAKVQNAFDIVIFRP